MSEPRLHRSTTDRKVAGVAGGVAEYFEVDPNLVRGLWLLSVLFFGAGVLLYVILWAILPESPGGLALPGTSNPALRIAEERYARGEITADELREIRATLTERP